MPGPRSLFEAQTIIEQGLDNYYLLLGSRRFLFKEYQLHSENDLQLRIIEALYSDQLDPGAQRQGQEDLCQRLFPKSPRVEALSAAVERLQQNGVLQLATPGGELALNFPTLSELQVPYAPGWRQRQNFSWQHGLAESYLLPGYSAAIWQRSQELADNQQQRQIVDRLLATVAEAGQPEGLDFAGLSLGQEISADQAAMLKEQLEKLSVKKAIIQRYDPQTGWPKYSLPSLPDPGAVSSSERQILDQIGSAKQRLLFSGAVIKDWHLAGRLESARQNSLYWANEPIEEAIINSLAKCQLHGPDPKGVDRQSLIDNAAQDCGSTTQEVTEVLDSSPVCRRLLVSRISATQRFSLVSEPGKSSGPMTELERDIGAQRCSELLFRDYQLAGYYRARGQGEELRNRLLRRSGQVIGRQAALDFIAPLSVAILDPDQSWVSEEYFWSAAPNSRRDQLLEDHLLSTGLIAKRPDPEGNGDQYSLLDAPGHYLNK